MTQTAQAPWLSDEIRSAERRRRIAERNWRSSKSESDWRAFKLLRNKVVFLMNKSRREFYTDFVSNFSDDQRKLFAATKKLFNQTAYTPFPPHGDKLPLANDMGSFFIKKMYRIFVLALMQLRTCAALLTAILLIVLRPLLLFAV